uniref:Putative secreted protein n=1 Tax=Psorophora albipes TaxID=869069 RepID=T1DG33_9DIPT
MVIFVACFHTLYYALCFTFFFSHEINQSTTQNNACYVSVLKLKPKVGLNKNRQTKTKKKTFLVGSLSST